CTDLDILATYLRRAFNDPKGPKKVRVSAYKDQPYDQLRQVFAACAAAGDTKATFSQVNRPLIAPVHVEPVINPVVLGEVKLVEVEKAPQPGEINLTKYAPKKP